MQMRKKEVLRIDSCRTPTLKLIQEDASRYRITYWYLLFRKFSINFRRFLLITIYMVLCNKNFYRTLSNTSEVTRNTPLTSKLGFALKT